MYQSSPSPSTPTISLVTISTTGSTTFLPSKTHVCPLKRCRMSFPRIRFHMLIPRASTPVPCPRRPEMRSIPELGFSTTVRRRDSSRQHRLLLHRHQSVTRRHLRWDLHSTLAPILARAQNTQASLLSDRGMSRLSSPTIPQCKHLTCH